MERRLRIVYLGTPDFAVLPLKRLVEAGYDVVGVVTNPDKPAGRGQMVRKSAVKEYAEPLNIPILQPERFKEPSFLSALEALKADLQVVVAFKMLPEVVWSMPPLGTINLHASLLPNYRGAAPINWAIMNGERETGVTTFLLQQEIDTGRILFRERVAIGDDMTAGELHDILMERGAELLLRSVDAINSGDYTLTEQDSIATDGEIKAAPKIFREDMRIDWHQSIDTIYNKVRGLSPFPTAWFEFLPLEGGDAVVAKLYGVEKMLCNHNKEAGSIWMEPGGERVGVYVPGGVLVLDDIQLAGRRRMSGAELFRGFDVQRYKIE